ncbi:tail fiber assembly protein [Luteibacter aegosomatis]|uniref:tail fiber assembly protein n=1 Tax=Luteibacter aegosomatis TaxID=2911537 RepID=UPI001FF82A3A|nr:tail fiber assembly protein [Luteibacter aegosomatis]UPG86866.1 tail fiber assembly protein [Luteibacter aegosomatis]
MTIALFAWIEDGIVTNITEWDGNTDPSTGGVDLSDGKVSVQIPDGVIAYIGYSAEQESDGSWIFEAPPAPVLSPEQILATNTATRNRLLEAAGLAIAPLQDAVDLGVASAQDQALLTAWKQFRVAVNRIDLTQPAPNWPVAPQGGYGAVVTPDEESA